MRSFTNDHAERKCSCILRNKSQHSQHLTSARSGIWKPEGSPPETTHKINVLRSNLQEFPSNFKFVLPIKTTERVVCGQLSNYMNRTGKLEDLQSAYGSNHSTETALLKVKTDIWNAMQNKQITCLILLGLSSAFDMISHSKLTNRLKFIFRLDGVVLNWITDYLANHTQCVVIKQDNFSDSATSSPVTLAQGIPQGLVLRPNLFSWFSSPLGDLCRK